MARQLRDWSPSFLLCTRHATRLGPERLDRALAGIDNALWYFDAPHRPEVLDLARRVRRTYVTWSSTGDWLRENGVTDVRFLPQAADLDFDAPAGEVAESFQCDLSFIGSGQYRDRWPLLQRLARECTMQIRGPGWREAPADLPVAGGEIRGHAFAQAVTGAAVSLGANALASLHADPASASNRMWKVLGCGGAYLGQWMPGIEGLAEDGVHCRWFHDADQASAILAELLTDPESRRAMAARGREYVLAHHTYDVRLSLILANGHFKS